MKNPSFILFFFIGFLLFFYTQTLAESNIKSTPFLNNINNENNNHQICSHCFNEQDISFESTDSATLNGILTLPSKEYLKKQSYNNKNNKNDNNNNNNNFPVVVLVQTHDQYPLDRNSSVIHESIFQGPIAPNMTEYDIQPFRDIAHYLAKRGIASLRYDSRDCFKDEKASCSNVKNPIPKDSYRWMIDDLNSAIKFLAKEHSSNIDLNQLSIACHHIGCFAASHVIGQGVKIDTSSSKTKLDINAILFLQASLEPAIDYFISKGEHHLQYLNSVAEFFKSIGNEESQFDYEYRYELAEYSHSQCTKIRDALRSKNSTQELKKLGDISCWSKHISEWKPLEELTRKGTIPAQLYYWAKATQGNAKIMVFNSPEDAYVTPSDYQQLHSFVFNRMQAKPTAEYLAIFGHIYTESSITHWMFPADYSSPKVSHVLLQRIGEFLCSSTVGYSCVEEPENQNGTDDDGQESLVAVFATLSSISFLLTLATICGLVYAIWKIQTSGLSRYTASQSSENDAYRVMTDDDL